MKRRKICSLDSPLKERDCASYWFNAQKSEPSFKDGVPNPHFHWHVIPRYNGIREFDGEVFEDPEFGNSFNLQRKKMLTGDFRRRSIEAIRNHLDIIYLSANDASLELQSAHQ